MAITTVLIDQAAPEFTVALSSSYLGASDYIECLGAKSVDVWCDDATLEMTIKWSFDGGTSFTPDLPLGTGSPVYTIDVPAGRVLTLDAKSDSGTPNIGGSLVGPA